ncbi:hypothetical protein LH464_05195 [Neorhizobium sp. T786]|uniref:hypothetical protein n=1 Tax=Pseudorhizobium xiangyangii TaxID=2883104 RepID=UPI001CFFD4AC|nr:hypothetical protein [Neorhizobium xiangyangii]MCB5201873.1 hypothetical protein [Neorhizobium xiangyangii]
MATSFYDVGSVTLTNGSAVVTGVGTLWQTALITNGFVAVEAPGNLLPILTVDSDSQITAEQEWTGATGTYSYGILRQTDQMQDNAENSRALAYVISEIRNGTLFKYDGAGDLTSLVLHDSKPKGYSYLVLEGAAAQLYVKASNAEGDWAGPFAYGVGPVGPPGPVGFLDFKGEYDAGEAYVANDGVRYNGSSWVARQPTTGNAPPNLPTTENAYWSLLAIKGQDGTGIGDMVAAVYDPQGRQADVFAEIDEKQLDLGRKPISSFIATGVETAAVFEIPSGCFSVLLSGTVITSAAGALTYMRLSFDGGTTYLSASDSYNIGRLDMSGSTISHSDAGSQTQVVAAINSGLAGVPCKMSLCVDSPAGLAVARFSAVSYALGVGTMERRFEEHGLSRGVGAPTHVMLFTSSGTFNVGTRVHAEAF